VLLLLLLLLLLPVLYPPRRKTMRERATEAFKTLVGYVRGEIMEPDVIVNKKPASNWKKRGYEPNKQRIEPEKNGNDSKRRRNGPRKVVFGKR
jgi:hypothetical protein